MTGRLPSLATLLLLLALAACRPPAPTATPGAATRRPPTATAAATATATIPATPPPPTNTPPPQPTAAPTPGDEESTPQSFGLYGSPENGLVVRVPSAWRVLEEGSIRMAPQASLLVSPRITADLPFVSIYTAATDEALLGAPSDGSSAIDLVDAFLQSAQLRELGSDVTLLTTAAETIVEARRTATGAVSLVSDEGLEGLVLLTAIIEGARRALVVAVAPAGASETELGVLQTIAGSVTFHDQNGIILRTGRITAGTTLRSSFDEFVPPLTFPGAARGGILFILVPSPEDNPQMVFRGADEATLATIDRGGGGEAEAHLFVPERTGNFALAISAPGGDGPFALHAVDVRPFGGTLVDTLELEHAAGQQVEYTFSAAAGQQYAIYVAPVGERAALTDAAVELLDVAANTLSRIDVGYQGEPEIVLFTPISDGTVAIRLSDFFGAGGSYIVTVATLP